MSGVDNPYVVGTTPPPSARPITSGSPSAPIWLVGEAPGAEEITDGRPFVGASGRELTKLLSEAGIDRSQCFITNVCHERPPNNEISEFFRNKTAARAQGLSEVDGLYPMQPVVVGRAILYNQIAAFQPRLVIAFGNTALWALTGLTGIMRHRGSIIPATLTPKPDLKIIPTAHPAAILREWSLRNIVLQDLRRARRESTYPEIRKPDWNLMPAPTFDEARAILNGLETALAHSLQPLICDIETRVGHIACVGIAWTKLDAICIPFMCVSGDHSFWFPEEELYLILKLRSILTNSNAHVVFQNGAYDLQYFAKEWGFLPNLSDDTMLMQHVAFPGLRKGLDFLSSLYCEYHRYWKDDGKVWDPALGELSSWLYNCEDCVRTFECWETLSKILTSYGLEKQYEFQIKRLAPVVIKMMLRGIRVNEDFRADIRQQLNEFIADSEEWLTTILGHPINVNSAPAMKKLFYTDFSIPPIINRKTRMPSLDDEAMDKIERKNPLLRPLFRVIRGIRTARTTLANVINTTYSPDGRARSSINLAKVETFRFSSSEDAFGDGGNLQNITKGDEDKEDKSTLRLPNIRRVFVPDQGYVMFEVDLKGADARVVAWEANDDGLKQAFKSGVDIHAFNAESIWPTGRDLADYKTDPKLKPNRFRAKTAIHAVNYGCKSRTLAEHTNTTARESEVFIKRWLVETHPGIGKWHERIYQQLWQTKKVANAFGYRRYYFDRVDNLLPEALAWIGQSTTAIAINHVVVQLDEQVPEAQVLLQVHDSVVFQIREEHLKQAIPRIRAALKVTVPYADPLEIPCDIKASLVSWGDMEDYEL